MAKADADLNLLFGILALQMDFITRDALIARHARLGPGQGQAAGPALAASEGRWPTPIIALLKSMVAEHVAMHGGDPQRSLAAVLAPRTVVDDLREVTNTDLQAAMSYVPADDTAIGRRPQATLTCGFGTSTARPRPIRDSSCCGPWRGARSERSPWRWTGS